MTIATIDEVETILAILGVESAAVAPGTKGRLRDHLARLERLAAPRSAESRDRWRRRALRACESTGHEPRWLREHRRRRENADKADKP